MNWKLIGVGAVAVVSFAILTHAVTFTDVPNEGAYPAAKSIINANNALIAGAINAGILSNAIYTAFVVSQGESNVIYTAFIVDQSASNAIYTAFNAAQVSSNALYHAMVGGITTNYLVLRDDGSTNKCLVTNGTLRVIQAYP